MIFRTLIVIIFFNYYLSHAQIRHSFEKLNNRYSYHSETINQIIDYAKQYLHKPYKYKIPSGHVLDCSGFIYHIFSSFGISLSRSASGIAQIVTKIPLEEAQIGDLIFFKGRDINSHKIGHISMITDITEHGIEMLHSCKRGIITEIFEHNKYYTSRFLFAGRIKQLYETNFNNYAYSNVQTCSLLSFHELSKYVHSYEGKTEKIISDNSNDIIIKIIAVGDIMLGTNYPNNSYLPPNDGKDLLEEFKVISKNADVVFGNLEGCFLTEDGPVKKCANPDKCYAFKMPNNYVYHLLDANFNLLSIANNHIGDFGDVGRRNTVNILKDAGIHFAGLIEYPYTVFEIKGLKIGFAAFAPNTGTVNINNYNKLVEIVTHLDTTCNIVIVSFHGGAEGPSYQNITRKTEIFLGENRGNPYEFARIAIDAGADIVLGHGPHVPRAIDLYKNKFIAYSLGNFATYGRFNISGPNGLAPAIEIVVDKEGNFLHGKIHSFKQIGKGQPAKDETNTAAIKIRELTKTNLPETQLEIDNEGFISIKQ